MRRSISMTSLPGTTELLALTGTGATTLFAAGHDAAAATLFAAGESNELALIQRFTAAEATRTEARGVAFDPLSATA